MQDDYFYLKAPNMQTNLFFPFFFFLRNDKKTGKYHRWLSSTGLPTVWDFDQQLVGVFFGWYFCHEKRKYSQKEVFVINNTSYMVATTVFVMEIPARAHPAQSCDLYGG